MQLRKNNNKNGFTLTEMLVTVVVLGLVAGFAIPNYTRGIQKARERDALLNLTMIHANNALFRSRNGTFLTDNPGTLTDMNNGFQINILPNDLVYSYTTTDGGVTDYTVTATGPGNQFRLELDETPLGPGNPCCDTNIAACRISPATINDC